MLSINNSVTSMNAQRHMDRSTRALGRTFARLASGMRINTSRDDAAGMAVVTRMVSQVRGMNAAVRNANDGISLSQVAEAALDETTNALQRMRELAVQSANSTYSSGDRANLHDEFVQMLREVQRIAETTEFNGVKLLGGSANIQSGQVFSGKFHIGADAGQTLQVTFNMANLSALGLVNFSGFGTLDSAAFAYSAVAASTVTGLALSIATDTGANAALSTVDSALDSISDIRATMGATMSRFETVIQSLTNVVENTDAARSRIQDADIATETAQLTRNTILQQAGIAILAQANQQPQMALRLLAM
ncbi:MAG: flagellin FliC [Magnetococcales bacterium]|nr:flagellin FliC [Magnetococcales bacterium]MBF0156411.1 flagellin FliC [Magnetococcales bacterium]